MDKHIKTEGIILRRISLNDADQIITILTKDLGKISVLAKGSRRTKNKFCGKTDLLNQIKISAFKGRNLSYLNEVESVQSWEFHESDLKTHSILFYISELTNRLVQDDQQINGIYDLIISSFDQIDQHPDKSDLILYTYTIKLLGLLGFMSPWNICSRTNQKIDLNNPYYLSIHDGNIIPSGYNTPMDPRLTPALIKWVNFMQKYPFAAILKVNPNKGEKVEVWTMIKMMLENLLNYSIKSEEFLNMVN